ncbi:beta strand repeat-containing protein [Tateyamaria sp. SN3-11]|uniref:beta strand repeat-containing protein n=1 Tax=Tateyamaria sp. SN3-11 TaxID=3092147 RepID=UPI0039EB7D87
MTTVNRPTIVITQQQASTGDAPDTNHRTVELSDGSFVVVYRLANGDIRFQQFDRVGNSIGDEGVLVAGSAGGDFDVLAIEDGQLVLAHETTSGDIEVSSFDVANGTATANGTVSETFSSTGSVFDPVLSGNSASDVALHFIETVSGVSSLQEHRSISGGQFSATTSTAIEATADSAVDSIILANGNRVVVVDPNGAGATGDGDVSIFLVAPDGTVVASPTATAPAGSAVSEVRVTGLVDGGFVVAYEADGADTDVLFQVFNADGSERTGAISAPNSSNQHETPEIAALEDGGFLVFFDEKTGGNTLIVQRFDANGDPIGQSSSVANGISVSSPSATILSDGLVAVSFLNAGVVNVTIIGTQGLDIVLTGADESINGTVIGDIIDGDAGNDTINGGSGLDELSGGLGDDLINGGSGDDTLLGGNGLDTIKGGSGDDRIIVRSFDFIDEIDGGDNTDTLDMSDYLFNFVTVNLLNETYTVGGGAGVQSIVNVENVIGSDTSDDDLTGDDEDNQIEGLGGNDTLNGLGGNDTLIGGKGDDEVFGGLGEDLIVWNNGDGSDLFNGGDGTDTVQINFNTDLENDDLQNDDEAEFKTGANGVDFARVRLNDQAVNGLFSLDIRETEVIDVNFGGGDDTARIIGDVADQAILDLNGGDGVDELDFSQAGAAVTVDLQTNAVGTIQFRNFENITGSDFDDTLIGTSSSKNFIEGGAGNDRIVGRGTGDTLSGGIGDDSINSGGALNILDGGEGNDTLTGTSKNETFRGGAGADVIIGGGGNQDMLDYSDSDAAVSVSLAGSSATVSGGHAEGDVISQVEHITGSEFGDFLSSNNNKVTIRGLGGDDRIIGGFNSDNLFGGQAMTPSAVGRRVIPHSLRVTPRTLSLAARTRARCASAIFGLARSRRG